MEIIMQLSVGRQKLNAEKLYITEGVKQEQPVNVAQAVQKVQAPQALQQPVKTIEKPQMQTLFNGSASGMKVGGL